MHDSASMGLRLFVSTLLACRLPWGVWESAGAIKPVGAKRCVSSGFRLLGPGIERLNLWERELKIPIETGLSVGSTNASVCERRVPSLEGLEVGYFIAVILRFSRTRRAVATYRNCIEMPVLTKMQPLSR